LFQKFSIMKKTIILSLLVLSGVYTGIRASEPVTLTKLYTVYNNLTEVNHVETHGTIDGTVLPFLTDPSNPIDQKAAVINALVVNNQNKNNAETFKMFMARQLRQNWETLDLTKLTATDLFSLGYLTLMDEDGETANALPILEMAKAKDPASSTIALIHAIAYAQSLAKGADKCSGWALYNQVLNDASLNKDMDREMVSIISRSMQRYGEGCD
jgi:hypothetical protein